MSKKDFLDEKIIEMIDEVEQPALPVEESEAEEEVKPEERTIYTGLKIMGKWVYFEERLLVEEKITMMVPEAFEEMSNEVARIKYPSEDRPNLILTDQTTAMNLMFNHMDQEIKNENVEDLRDQVINGMTRLNPGIKTQGQGVEVISDRNVAYVEFTNPALDGKLYNLMYFLELEGRSLMVSFNCQTKNIKYWKEAAFEMMHSIKIVQDSNQEEGEIDE